MQSESFTPPPRPEGHLTPQQVANRLNITRQAVQFWCRDKPGLAIRVDGRWWIAPDKLTAFLRDFRGGAHVQQG